MSFAEWIVLASVCFAGASSPGPSLVLMMRAVIKGGRLAGVVFGLTHGFGILLYATLVIAGLGAVMLASPVLFTILEIAGILFLFWIAASMVRGGLAAMKTHSAPVGNELKTETSNLASHARDGFLIVFLNPKVAAFFLAIFSQFLSADHGLGIQMLMVMTAFVIDTSWYVLIALIIALPKLLRILERHAWRLELFIGVMLLFISALLIWKMATGA